MRGVTTLIRLWRHLSTPRWLTRRRFDPATCASIERAVRAAEQHHRGEIRFVVESALPPAALRVRLTSRQRAEQLFAELGVWDTADNAGVLIYVLMAERVVEIVADRGIDARIGAREWLEVCARMQDRFRAGRFREGAVDGVEAVGALLARHFPTEHRGADELPNQPLLL